MNIIKIDAALLKPVVPQSVSRAQGKAALIIAGKFDAVMQYVDRIPDASEKALAQVALNDTTEWTRESAFLNNAAEAIGLTDQDLDDLFISASKIDL